MSKSDGLSHLAEAERNALESLLMTFEEDWSPSRLKELYQHLESKSNRQFREHALNELVKIDLQRRWSIGQGKILEEYVEQFPLLPSTDTLAAELIAIEYVARCEIDKNLTLESYATRFPRQVQRVTELLAESRVSNLPTQAPMTPPLQASIETSRMANVRDTKSTKKKGFSELPVEFGRYRILRELGSGAMGTVHLAHDNQLDRQVALKTPSFDGQENEDLISRFYREARSAAKIHHRNICPIYDVGEIEGQHFISMAFIKGRPMSELIKPDSLPPQRTSAVLVHRIALALAEAHRLNVIHRDLKPANVMIDKKREPVVMDFGLARQTDVESRMTQSGMMLGTPAYMSPEQISGKPDEIGKPADIYSLGVILYELLTGKLPFTGSMAQVVCQILQEEPTPPSNLRPSVDPGLEAICARMMAKKVSDRFGSMTEVADAIKTYLSEKKQPRTAKPPSNRSTGLKSRPDSVVESQKVSETGVLNEYFAAQMAKDPRQTSLDSTPAKSLQSAEQQSYIPKAVPLARSKKATISRFANFNGRGKWIAAGVSGAAILLLGIVFMMRTPYGTLRVETIGELDGLEVLVDGNTVSLTDSKRAKAADHELQLKLDGAVLDLDPDNHRFVFSKNGSEHRLSVSIGAVELSSKKFTVARNEETILKIELLPNNSPEATALERLATNTDNAESQPVTSSRTVETGPRTPLPSGPTGEALTLSGHSRKICGLEFTHDGHFLVSNSEDKTIRVWDLTNGRQRHSIDWGGGARDLAVSPTDPWFAVCGTYGRVEIFDWETGRSLHRLSKGSGLYMGVDFSPDGKYVIATNLDDVGKLWDARTGELLHQFAIQAPENADCNVHFLPDGKGFLVAPSGRIVQRFELRDCQHIVDLKFGNHSPGRIAIAPNGQRVASAGFDGSITLYDLVKQEKVITVKVGRGANSVNWSPDGRWIAAIHSSATDIIDSKSMVSKHRFETGEGGNGWAADFSPDSRFLATTQVRGINNRGGYDIKVWRVNDESSISANTPKLTDRTIEDSVSSANKSGGAQNLRIPDTEQSPNIVPQDSRAQSVDLIGEDSLFGWEVLGHRGWRVKNGILIGQPPRKKGVTDSWLIRQGEFDNFEMEFEYQLEPGGNSGVFVRAVRDKDLTAKKEFYEIQLLDDTAAKYANVADNKRNGSLWNALPANPPLRLPPNQWHRMKIRVDGERLQIWSNDRKVVEGKLPANQRMGKRIGLQLHTGQTQFRNMQIRKMEAGSSLGDSPEPSARTDTSLSNPSSGKLDNLSSKDEAAIESASQGRFAPIKIDAQADMRQMALAPDGRSFVTTGSNTLGVVTIWDVKNGNRLGRIPVNEGGIGNLTFSTSGDYLLFSTARSVRVVSVSDGTPVQQIEFPTNVTFAPFPKRDWIACLYYEGGFSKEELNSNPPPPRVLSIWDWKSKTKLLEETIKTQGNQSPYWPAISPDEKYLTVGMRHFHVRYEIILNGDTVTLKNPTSLETTSLVRGPLIFSNYGHLAATPRKDRQSLFAVLNVQTGRVLHELDKERWSKQGSGCRLAFLPDGKRLAVADHEGGVSLWDGETGKLIRRLYSHRDEKLAKFQTPGILVTPEGKIISGGGPTDRQIIISSISDTP